MKRFVTIFFLLSLILFGCQRTSSIEQVKIKNEPETGLVQTSTDTIVEKPVSLPQPAAVVPSGSEESSDKRETADFVDYEVPFTSQAPYGDWDELHQEACEEASMIMVNSFFNDEILSPHTADQQIMSLDKWEKNNGYSVDLSAEETSAILENYFQLKVTLITDFSVERIKKELIAGNLIIVPAAGRELGNPYFRQPGPIYHMLVIRGYDDENQEFITNDPGTKRGKGFRYDYQTLLQAIADWDWQLAQDGMTAEEIKQGRKVMIAVEK